MIFGTLFKRLFGYWARKTHKFTGIVCVKMHNRDSFFCGEVYVALRIGAFAAPPKLGDPWCISEKISSDFETSEWAESIFCLAPTIHRISGKWQNQLVQIFTTVDQKLSNEGFSTGLMSKERLCSAFRELTDAAWKMSFTFGILGQTFQSCIDGIRPRYTAGWRKFATNRSG